MAPEYFIHGIVDEKIDVFAFGVLLLEIITGRRAVDTASRQSIVAWVIIMHRINLTFIQIIINLKFKTLLIRIILLNFCIILVMQAKPFLEKEQRRGHCGSSARK